MHCLAEVLGPTAVSNAQWAGRQDARTGKEEEKESMTRV